MTHQCYNHLVYLVKATFLACGSATKYKLYQVPYQSSFKNFIFNRFKILENIIASLQLLLLISTFRALHISFNGIDNVSNLL